MANWLKKMLEARRRKRYPLYGVLLQKKDEVWDFTPPGHTQVSVNRWIVHIPNALAELPASANVLVADSTFVTGTTILALRAFFADAGLSTPLVACLVQILHPEPRNPPPEIVVLKTKNADFMYPWGPAS